MASAVAVASTSKSVTPPKARNKWAFSIGDEVSIVANGRVFFGSIKDIPNSAEDKVNVKWIKDPLVTEVHLPSLQNKYDLLLTDRSLFKGCKVRAVADGGSNLIGVCRSLILQADLRILGTQTIIPAVSVQERVTPLKEFKQRSIVFYNGFIGIITDVERSVRARIISKETKKSLVFKTFLAQSKNSARQNVEMSWINEVVQKSELSDSVSFLAEGDDKIFDEILSTEYVIFIEDLQANKVVVSWKHNIDLEQPDKPPSEFKGDKLKNLLIVKEELSNESSYQCGNLGKFQLTHEDPNFQVLTDWDRNFVKKNYSEEKLDLLQREYPLSLWSYLNETEKEERIQPRTTTSTCIMIHKLTTTGDIMWNDDENKFEKSTDLFVENQSLFENIFICGDFVYSEKFMSGSYKKVYGVVIKNNLAEKKVFVKILTNESSPTTLNTVEIPEKFIKRHPRYMYLNQNDSIVVRVIENVVHVGNPILTNLKGQVLVKWAKIVKEHWVYPFELSIYCTRGHDDIEQIFSKIELEEDSDSEETTTTTDDNGNMVNSCPIPCKKPSLGLNVDASNDEPMEVDEEPTSINSIFLEKVDMSLSECPDIHIFIKTPFDTNYTCFLKTIQRELKNLTELCPESMKIKGFANRIDLFSIAIAGPDDTPYENSLYLFDASLPSNYPNVPPKVHFHSCGAGRLNPNLYAEGKVCVSLLGTWSGKNDHEKWTKDSTLAQVLISIQALILNAHPYHNEPGWDRSLYKTEEEAKKHSGPYNAQLIPLVGKMIINQLKNPFQPWEDDIKIFYKSQLPLFISRWELYLSDQEIPKEKQPKFSINLQTPGLKTGMEATLKTLKELLAKLE